MGVNSEGGGCVSEHLGSAELDFIRVDDYGVLWE